MIAEPEAVRDPREYDWRLEACPCCDGAGEWDEGPLPCSSAAVEPTYRQVICGQCDGTGLDFVEVEPIELEDTLGALAPKMGGYGHWQDWNGMPRFSDEVPAFKDMMPEVNWDTTTLRNGKWVVVPWGAEPYRPPA